MTLPVTAAAAEPDLTDATVAVTPSVDLVDFQEVTVAAENFDPVGSTLYVAQCSTSVTGSISISDCDTTNLGTVAVPEGGDAELSFTVRREIRTANSGLVDCAVAPGCVIGAGTLGPGLATVVEGAAAEIAFDPDVPATPRLEVEVEVVSASATSATITLTCNRDAEAYVEASLWQEIAGQSAAAYGYQNAEVACSTTPREIVIPLAPGFGRFKPGEASLSAYASAYDGFESASGFEEFTFELRGATNNVDPIAFPGESMSVSIIGSSGAGTNLAIEIEVVCSTPLSYVSVYFDASQFAGRNLVQAGGSTSFADCAGTERVSVPVRPSRSGTLVGGPARVGVMVYGYTEYDDGEFFSDGAGAVDIVRLRGRVPVAVPDTRVEGTYISIGATSPTAISGTVTCDEPASVYLDANTFQTRGRVSIQAYGGIEIECDGVTSFSIPISGESFAGSAVVFVYGYAYRIIEDPEDPFDNFEYVWDDFVATSARLRR